MFANRLFSLAFDLYDNQVNSVSSQFKKGKLRWKKGNAITKPGIKSTNQTFF